MRKKICFLSGDITRSGGTEKVSCQIMAGLSEKYEISVLSLTHSNTKMFYPLTEQIKRTALFAYHPNGIKQYFQIVRKIKRYLKENQTDILVDIDTILDMFSVAAVKGLSTKLVGWEHFNFQESMGNKLRVPIRKHITRHADCVVTLTKEDQKAYSDYFGNRLRIEQIYNPVEFSKDQKTYDAESKTIISVGRLARQKGFDYLLEVAELVFAKHPDWEWQILGEGDERPALEQLISEKKLHQVKLLGQVGHVEEYLQKSAMYVLTSRFEGFPLVLIEAKANKLPVVSFRCRTGPSELVKDGVNGYLVDCFDKKQMAERICELIEDQEMRIRFSMESGRGLDELNYGKIIQQWGRLIESI